jgi:hypothetical protein
MVRRLVVLGFAIAAAIGVTSSEPMRVSAQQSAAEKQKMIQLGLQYKTAWDLYGALKKQANGAKPLTWQNMPDWSGLWTKTPSEGANFDPDQPRGGLPTAKLKPEARARMMKRVEDAAKGIEYDPISDCSPPGFPRWLGIPFLREFIVRPEQTWLTSETVNNVRRIYTDGRDHIPQDDRYPLPYGDSIGFWDGQKLVIHTNQIKGAIYTRSHPDYSDETETVEIWQKISPTVIEAKVWVYDPPNLLEPWYVRHTYTQLPNADKQVRIRYWDCNENKNNAVVQTKEGGSTFSDFTFTDKDDKQPNQQRSK